MKNNSLNCPEFVILFLYVEENTTSIYDISQNLIAFRFNCNNLPVDWLT